MITASVKFNGEVTICLRPETEEDVAVLELACKSRVPLTIKDGTEPATKLLIMGHKQLAKKAVDAVIAATTDEPVVDKI